MSISIPCIDFIGYWALLDPPARPVFREAYGGIEDGALAHARALAFAVAAMVAGSAAYVGRHDVADRSFAALDRILAD